MKISIITVSYNSGHTISDTIDSVLRQTYPHIEYIIIDGASTDNTIEIIKSYGNSIHTFISEPDNGLYDAINKGILLATGGIVGILNSDDFFASPDIINSIANAFEQEKTDVLFGDVAYVKPLQTDKIIRYYSSGKFSIRKFAKGYMPAHPTFYIKRELYLQFGLYKTTYKIAADFEFMTRLLHTNNIRYKYIPMLFVFMRIGGISNRNPKNIYLANKEIVRACKENGISTNLAILALKYFSKMFEFVTPLKKIRSK